MELARWALAVARDVGKIRAVEGWVAVVWGSVASASVPTVANVFPTSGEFPATSSPVPSAIHL